MTEHRSGFDQWVDANDDSRLQGTSGSLGLGDILPQPRSASSVGLVGTLESSLLPQFPPSSNDVGRQLLEHTPTQLLPDSGNPPYGWPGFVSAATMGGGAQSEGNDKLVGSLPSRGGLFDNEQFISQLADTNSTRIPNSLGGMTLSHSGTWGGFSYPSPPVTALQPQVPGLRRPETPALAYVDRASMPGYIDTDERECHAQQLDRDSELRQASSWSVARDVPTAAVQSLQDWEADLLAFKRLYGCPDTETMQESVQADTKLPDDARLSLSPSPKTRSDTIDENVPMSQENSPSNFGRMPDLIPSMVTAATREAMEAGSQGQLAGAQNMGTSLSLPLKMRADTIDSNALMSDENSPGNFGRTPDSITAPRESMVDIDIRSAELHRASVPQSQRPSVLPDRPTAPELSSISEVGSQGPTKMASRELLPDSYSDGLRSQSGTGNASQRPSVIPPRPICGASPDKSQIPRESMLNTNIDYSELMQGANAPSQRPSVIPPRPGCGTGQELPAVSEDPTAKEIPRESMLNTNIDYSELMQEANAPSQRPSVIPPRPGCGTGQELPAVTEDPTAKKLTYPNDIMQNMTLGSNEATMLRPPELNNPGAKLRKEAEDLDSFQDPVEERQAKDNMLATAEEQSRELKQEIVQLRGSAVPNQIILAPPLTPKSPTVAPPSRGRQLEYTPQDLDVATEKALIRVKPDGSWRSEYTETGLQKRDFYVDIRKQREKDKGRQATGPIWAHLASQAKNLANTLDLPELLEALKLFASVRFDDYELYMRLLGEVPNHVGLATAAQLCELVRILARRRLRERNYVDMVAAHLLQKIRVTDDALPVRQLVKAANAFAALECRSNPKFVEHFLRHMEHRMQELDAAVCCLVSPVFVDQYMNDALRRAYLVRCAETHAGFQCELQEARNIACTELVLRKEHHSLVSSSPPYVIRYLEKVRKHAEFDKWGAVTLPATVAPDGPKGNERVAMSHSLQLKASTANSGTGRQADVFSSDMHRDVSACLTHLGVEHENGVLAGPYLLDIVALDMVTPSKRIVYEVNADHHYYVGTQQLIAERRLRHRMIARLGHKLHMVNADDWKKMSAAQKMTSMLKLQQAQQDVNAKDEKLKAAANTMRAPLPALPLGPSTTSDPMKLKSISDLRAPIRVPVPPSQRTRLPLSAR